ncbi:MAG: hypothetical protein V1723_01885, partial [Candidatus Uhrbacteria bacterium]
MHRLRLLLTIVLTFFVSGATVAFAGSLTPSAAPVGTMKSLQEVYDSVAGTFDSSGISASASGSLIQQLKYIVANIGWSVSGNNLTDAVSGIVTVNGVAFSSAGVVTGATGLTSTGNITLSGAQVLGASPLVFEGSTDNDITTTLAITDPTTINKTITFPNATGTVALTSDITGTNSGTNTGDQTITLTGDVTGTGTGSFAATIATDSVALTADTTGEYVKSVGTSAVTGLTGGAVASEGATLTLALDYTATLAADPALAASACVFATTGLICEGATANGFETLLTFTDPTTDKTITFPDATITVNAAGDISGTTLASGVTGSSLTSVGTLIAGATGTGFTLNFTNSTLSGNITGTNISSVDISDDTNLSATNGITLTGDQLTLATTAAGGGLTYTDGVLAVGAGTGITVNADSIDVALGTSIVNAELVDDTIDWDKIVDATTLDADTTIAVGAGKEITYNKTLTDATAENGLVLNFTAADTTSATTSQFGLYLDNIASAEGVDALLVLDNSDTDDVVGAAIKIVNAGGGFTSGIDMDGVAIVWSSTGTAVTGTNYQIGRDADATNQMHFNVPTGAGWEWSINDVAIMTLNSTTLNVNGGASVGELVATTSSSTGVNDAKMRFILGSATQWAVGADNSNGDVFSITNSQLLGASGDEVLTISSGDTSGGNWVLTQLVNTTDSPIAFTFATGAHTTLTNADLKDVYFDLDATKQFTGAAGATTVNNVYGLNVAAPVYSTAGAGALTITSAATVYVAAAPSSAAGGGGTTISNPYAIWVDAGDVRFDADLSLAGGDITGANSEAIDIGEATNDEIQFTIGGNAELQFALDASNPTIQFTDGDTLKIEDTGGNDMLTLADGGAVGNLTATGSITATTDLTVTVADGNTVNIDGDTSPTADL